MKPKTQDGMLRALPPHLTRPPKHKRRSTHTRSRPIDSSPLSLPPFSSPDPEKGEPGTASVVIEAEVASLEEITSPHEPSAVDQKVSALEDKVDAMQARISTLEKEAEVLKKRFPSQ